MPYIKEYKLQYFLVLIGIILTVAATTATAQIMKPLMDDMFINRDESMLYLIPLGMLGIYFLKALGRYVQSVYMNYIGMHIVSRFREILLEKIIRMDMGFLYLNRSGELISRVTNDIGRIQYFVSNMLPELFRESMTVLSLIGYVIYLNPKLAFYSLILVPLIIYPLMTVARKLKKYSHRSQAKNADVMTRLTEVFNNSEIIKANATEAFEMKRFSLENWNFFRINMKSVYVGELVSPIMEVIGAGGLAAVIFVGGHEVYNNHMTVGEFTAFLTAVGLVFQPVRRIGSIYSKIQDAVAASERVFEVLDIDNAIKGGKSTLINLILRFYETSSGEIRINGRDIKEYTQKSLRHHISLVSQRVYIFQDTLAANVAYGQDIDRQRVEEALRLADASEFVAKLENGIDTLMEEFGSNLSGGQRQRIAIARAIYKHASLLLFDEATSALDNESEKRIQNALKNYAKDKITITIAHRLSTIEDADMILVFQAGRIVASGTHQELLENSDNYKKLAGKLAD